MPGPGKVLDKGHIPDEWVGVPNYAAIATSDGPRTAYMKFTARTKISTGGTAAFGIAVF